MVLSLIYHVIKKIFKAIIKAIAWLLVALSLWVPLLYALIFVIVCGLTHTRLTSVSVLFYAGLALTFVVSFFVSNFLYERRKKEQGSVGGGTLPANQKQYSAQLKKKSEVLGDTDALPAYSYKDSYKEPEFYEKDEFFNRPKKNTAYALDDFGSEFNPAESLGYQKYNLPKDEGVLGGQDLGGRDLGAHDGGLERSPLSMANSVKDIRLNSERQNQEKPKVFAMRADPTVFAYEYADRVEFFKRTRQGMVFMRTELK